ncbi:hypothetical protein EZV62_013531 [Acer yangbiense]|uniref:Bulb-type lectin domain-containing protein n=1 Tax=Acer yangbiense TaxID=1000413 RepID=A0A5C7HZI1_9ROSI|nr:hypothetical protein EZV62_013531 [Acer yangbiense]
MGVAMETWNSIHLVAICSLSIILFCSETCTASVRKFGKILPGFQGSQMNWVDNDGLFLLSNNSDFAFGFQTTEDVTLFLLVVMHRASTTNIWTANRGSPVSNSDKFVFNQDGKVLLQRGGSVVWSIDTNGSVSAIGLLDSGNLVLLGDDDRVVWESFSHPTDTLISNQNFTQGMRLVSNPNSNNLSYFLEIKSGDVILSAGFRTPQPYWSMGKDERKTINKDGGEVTLASLSANSWRFYDQNNVLLWQFIFTDNSDGNATWIAVLVNDGSISFYQLQSVGSNGASPTKIPKNQCSTPEPCDPYYACSGSNKCQCPTALSSINCKTGIVSPCDRSKGSTELVNAGDGLNYFALGFVSPSSNTDLDSCKASCLGNCSCLALFFQNSSRNCFMFDRIGSFQSSAQGSDFVSYIKVLSDGGGGANAGGDGSSQKRFPIVVIIVISTVIVIAGLLYLGFRYYRKKRKVPDSPHETSEEDNFLQKGKLNDILDSRLRMDEYDERVFTALKVALWCIQEDMHLRPPMTKVVQMLEGICPVPQPPTSSPLASRLYSGFFKSISEEGTSSGPSDCNSDAYLSAVRLSGPR